MFKCENEDLFNLSTLVEVTGMCGGYICQVTVLIILIVDCSSWLHRRVQLQATTDCSL